MTRDDITPQVTPQLREWKSLTFAEIDFLMPYCHNEFDLSDYRKFASDLEDKLREKNMPGLRRATRDEKIRNPGVYWVEDKE